MKLNFTLSAVILAVSTTLAFVVLGDLAIANQIFTPDPATPLHNYDYAVGQQVQRFNGLFAKRLIEQVSDSRIRSCLRGAGNANIVLKSFDSGSVQVESSSLGCVSATSERNAQAIGPATGTVNLSAARLLGLALANDKFNEDLSFAKNDRDLAHYDVEFYDYKDGNLHVLFTVQRQWAQPTIAGCPSTGPIDTTYIIDSATSTARIGRMAC
ncbi:MAG: hypothetical protein GIW97_06270 [Candidatus Eremiobacteraeota bacterium]|nr:hypothetical protein [Candidatus Eremiobacteraeota bacterium]